MTTLLTMKGFNKQTTPITTAWIYHNPSLWLISLSSDWSTWITIADKNLWATQVYNDGDALSEANCGKYYQWWNNYGFPFTWPTSTSSTLVDTSWYGPWNYYSSSTFITVGSRTPYDWSSPQNDNLWWDVTDTNIARQWPCANWYHIPSWNELKNLINIYKTSLWLDWSGVGTYLKIPLMWQIDSEWNLRWRWSQYRLPSTSPDDDFPTDFTEILIYWNLFTTSAWYRMYGFGIRPFANTPVQPDDSRTVLYPTN